jgi:hypothetical protein
MQSFEVHENQAKPCNGCDALIAWNISRYGKKYPTEVRRDPHSSFKLETARNWFHNCPRTKPQSNVIEMKAPATFAPAKETKAAQKQAMAEYVDKANQAQLLEVLQVIYDRQTADEKQIERTHNRNSVGFSGFDAEILSSFARQAKSRGFLTEKQEPICRKKMRRYAAQLLDAAKNGEWTPATASLLAEAA